jgi:hypothetical protein
VNFGRMMYNMFIGSITHLMFEYTLASGKLFDLQPALENGGFSTHSFFPSSFKEAAAGNFLDHVLFSPRNVETVSILDMFRGYGNFPVDPRTTQLGLMNTFQGARSLPLGYKYMCGEGLTNATIERRNDVKVLNEWASSMMPPEFRYTSIVVLQNSACPVHAGKNNMGLSAIITLGDHSGGELWVYNDDGGAPLMCRNTPHFFDTILLQTVDHNLLNNFRRNLLSVSTCAVQTMYASVYDGKTKWSLRR